MSEFRNGQVHWSQGRGQKRGGQSHHGRYHGGRHGQRAPGYPYHNRNQEPPQVNISETMANYFELKIDKEEGSAQFYLYEVVAMGNHAMPLKFYKPCVEAAVRKLSKSNEARVSFDPKSRNFVHPMRLFKCDAGGIAQKQSIDVLVDKLRKVEPKETQKMSITIKFLKVITLTNVIENREQMYALDLVLKNDHPDPRYLETPLLNVVKIDKTLGLWQGHYYKAVEAKDRIFAKVDVYYKGQWYTSSIADFREPANLIDKRLAGVLKGLTVWCTASKQEIHIYKVNSVTTGRKICEENSHEGNKKLKDINDRDIKNTLKNYLHVGPARKKLYCAVEDCTVAPNQANCRTLNKVQAQKMIENASVKPDKLHVNIMNGVTGLTRLNNDERKKHVAERLRCYGITLTDTMTTVREEYLPPPNLVVEKAKPVLWKTESEWVPTKSFNRQGKTVARALVVSIVDLTYLNDNPVDHWVTSFATNSWQKTQGFQNSISIDEVIIVRPHIVVAPETPVSQLLRSLESVLKYYHCPQKQNKGQKTVDLVIAITPDSRERLSYHACVKRVFEVEHCIPSLCFEWSTLSGVYGAKTMIHASSFYYNALMKLNAKLGGINHSLHSLARLDKRRTSFQITTILTMGAVIGTPINTSRTSNEPYSIACVAGNIGVDLFRHTVQWRLQKSRVDEIVDLKSMVKTHILNYGRSEGKRSLSELTHIFFYRACSEEHVNERVQMVYESEKKAIDEAVEEVIPCEDGKAKKRVVYILVRRPNHTKFFHKEDSGNILESNPKAGFFVDNTITHPKLESFFLMSHYSKLGTAKPAEYIIMTECTGNEKKDFALLSHSLCFMYCRCNKSIPIPALLCYAKRWSGKHLTYLIRNKHLNWDNEGDIVQLGINMNKRTNALFNKIFGFKDSR